MPDSTIVKHEHPLELEWQKVHAGIIRFSQVENFSIFLLLICTAAALIMANSPLADAYHHFWHTQLTVTLGHGELSNSLHHWVSDGLMVIFFFLVGLEVKREILVGELSSMKKAALPLAAAVGGMAVPALLFAATNWGGEGMAGWGIPMATAIAFALGVLSLMGSRIPPSLKVFLAALAIADDIGAVLVIAVFYTAQINWVAMQYAMAAFGLLILMNLLGVRNVVAYLIVGFLLWLELLQSGVHATIAGVLVAMTIPAAYKIDHQKLVAKCQSLVTELSHLGLQSGSILTNPEKQEILEKLEATAQLVRTPLLRLEHGTLPWVQNLVLPIFALANAGIALAPKEILNMGSVGVGVLLGLVLGKPLGIFAGAWLATRLGMAQKPEELSWRHLLGAGCLGGIGFTMSLFIAALAYGEHPAMEAAKLGVFLGSVAAGVAGFLVLRCCQIPHLAANAAPVKSHH